MHIVHQMLARIVKRIASPVPLAGLALVAVSMSIAATTGAAESASVAKTRTVQVNGNRIAYRVIGPDKGVPLLLLNRFRGTMDHWDPRLIDTLSNERRVVMFDQPGFARSEGTPPADLPSFASSAAEVAKALGISQLDVLGYSMGGTVALQLLLDHPGLVRRAVIAGSGPGHVPNLTPDPDTSSQEVWRVATKPTNSKEDFLFLFFERSATSQQAGREYLERLDRRWDAFSKEVDMPAWKAQLASAGAVQNPASSLLPRLAGVRQPILVANGRHDIMVPTYASYAMAQQLPNATLVVYPDSGHGFLFQYPEEFGHQVLQFLR